MVTAQTNEQRVLVDLVTFVKTLGSDVAQKGVPVDDDAEWFEQWDAGVKQ